MEHAQGMRDQGKREHLISSEDCLGERMLGFAGVPFLGECLSHEAVKLSCSWPFPL